jgi:two-component system, NtrC family, response regulator AtoC
MGGRTTITDPGMESDETAGEGLAVLVMSLEAFASYPLPSVGAVVIGRSEDADVRLEDPLASRRHARLHLGSALQLEDLGSANGTRLRNSVVPPGSLVGVGVGETIGIGSTMLVVQSSRAAAGTRRVWSHRWFEGRLIDECSRCVASEDKFVLARLRLERPTPWSKVVPLIDRNLPSPHVFAAYGPHDYELLLLDAGADEANQTLAAIHASLIGLETPIRTGIALYPRDGRTADALMGAANAQLRPPEPAPPAASLPGSGPTSTAMQPVHDLARRAAKSNINVLILGETGVGKEVMAQALHKLSPRAGHPILALNCAGLAESLIESELFGHERGAFTGAVSAKKGLFEAASGGTLFLDEIGEMPLQVQARLLRAIANREILPVGATRTRAIDVRIVAATNRDLEAEVARGAFREDLFYRLNGITLQLPPLRERREEILELARGFIAEGARAAGRPGCVLSPEASELLLGYDWPGNIRQLRNVIERAMVLCEGEVIDLSHLPADRMRAAAATLPPRPPPVTRPATAAGRVLTAAEEDDRRRIVDALEASTWNQSRAAKALGIHRRTLISKLDRYGIPRPQKHDPTDPPEDV